MAAGRRWANIPRPRQAAAADSPLPAGRARVRYEGYGPGGAAVLVCGVTADAAATRERLRGLFARHGGHLGAPDAVGYLFNTVGVLSYPPGTDARRLARAAYAAGAEAVVGSGELEVLTDPVDLPAVQERLAAQGLAPRAAQVTLRAWDAVPLCGEDARCMLRLLCTLDAQDDVRNVYSNAEIPEEIVADL